MLRFLLKNASHNQAALKKGEFFYLRFLELIKQKTIDC